jgi:hypothetical protein
MHVKINRGNKSKAMRKRNLQESFQEFNMQESSNNHNSIETIEIIEAINSTEPKVNDIPLQTNIIESIEITKASNPTDPKACYIPTVQINTNLGAQPKNSTNVASTPKHLVPCPNCPFLRRNGHCLKGSKIIIFHLFGEIMHANTIPFRKFSTCNEFPNFSSSNELP